MSPLKGPSTYLHAGAGSKGWPHDHKAEDTFDLPPPQPLLNGGLRKDVERAAAQVAEWQAKADAISEAHAQQAFLNSKVFTPEALDTTVRDDGTEYLAEFTSSGGAVLVKVHTQTKRTIVANFNNFEDARTAAWALNDHHGH